MSDYNFSTLNDKDLEVLVRDLLTQELSFRFQNFKVGKDKGIDLRYSTNNAENEIIVQVKHYFKSGINQLISKLKTEEKLKIENLKPNRYILATSVDLSPDDKEKIKNILSPFILNTNDIYGSGDLNGLISKFPLIEKKHFKLWFSNVNTIQKVVNNAIQGRSAFIESKIKRIAELYVVNKSYEDAMTILRKHKILLITGIPGIGKTSLAYIITYKLLSDDFRLVYIDEKIRDAEDMFDDDVNVKQLFFFDDFLGSNYLEITNLRNTDKSIVNFIERVKSTPNKFLILTTRSTILNQAKSNYDKLSRANLDSLKYEIEIAKYTDVDKANILYNHLFFNQLPTEMISEIFSNKNYWKIIKHRNYNPRFVEFFTKQQNISHIRLKGYFDFITYHLDNPDEIWASAFANQLNEEEKFLLFTLLSFGRKVEKGTLETAFDERMKNEKDKYGFTIKINIFNTAFRNLLDGYITNTISNRFYVTSDVDFINPSLRDYLIYFFNSNSVEKWRTIDSFLFIEQFWMIFKEKGSTANNIIIEAYEIERFIDIVNSRKLKSIYSNDIGNVNLRVARFLHSYKSIEGDNYIDALILNKLKEIEWDSLRIVFVFDLLHLIQGAINGSELYLYFKSNWDTIIKKLVKVIEQESDLDSVVDLFGKYQESFNNYRTDDIEWYEIIDLAVNRIYETEAKEIIEQNQYEVSSAKDFERMEEKVIDKFYELSSKYLNTTDISPKFSPLDYLDSETLIKENKKAENEAENDNALWEDYRFEDSSNESIIDDLFSTFEK